MSRLHSASLGWVLAAVLMVSLATVCIIQYQALQNERGRVREALDRSASRIENQMELGMARWLAIAEDIRHVMSQVKSVSEPAQAGKVMTLSTVATDVNSVAEGNAEAGNAGDRKTEDLPLISEGVEPLQVLRNSLDEILKDPLFNPKGKRLSLVEAALANAELTRAQGQLKTLDSEIQLEMIQGMEKLRPLGAFVEYRPGEDYLREEGVLTSAETTEAGTLRMYYLRPDEFPDIYEKKSKKVEIAEGSMRRLLAILNS